MGPKPRGGTVNEEKNLAPTDRHGSRIDGGSRTFLLRGERTGCASGGSHEPGQRDMVAQAGSQVWLFEFKVVERAATGAAMAHLKGASTRASAGARELLST